MNVKCFSISDSHQKELLGSAIVPEIISLNFLSVGSDEAYDLLFYSPDLERTNTGGLTTTVIQQYVHLEYGGWWCSGLNALTLEDSMWGCLKPNSPRQSAEKKIIKYEHPYHLPTEVFCLKVGSHQWGQIAKKAGADCPALLTIAKDQIPSLFWQWVKDNPSIPILITEGAKKAASLLSHGYAAIGLPGIYGGYRTPKNENKEPTGEPRYLIPQLEAFCQEGREFVFAFDNDKKESTIKAVKTAIAKTGELIEAKGCKVSVMVWFFDVKGIDDLITKYQETNLDNIFSKRIALSEYCPQFPLIKAEDLPPLKEALSLLLEQDISPIEELDKLAQIKGLYRRLYAPVDVE
ncbi:MAG: hypothetical protein RLZZ490_1738, partial [Cyanobacteriota bacterium]